MGGRVVDCARLESVYAARHPGFESPPIRHLALGLGVVWLAPTQDLGCLSHFDDAVSRQHTPEICSWINDAVSANDRAGIQDRIASNFGTISDDRAKLPQAGRNHSIGREDGNLGMVEFNIGQDHSSAEMRLVADDRVAHVAEVRNLRFIENDAVLELT